MEDPFPEAGVEFDRASAARMYDYFLGGAHHFAVDREHAARLPDARVAYVDYEPVAVAVAVAHGEEIVADLATVTATRADLRDPGAVLAAPGVADLLDFSRPVALLAVSCLHFVGDEVHAVTDRYRSALAPGSVIGISHVSDDVAAGPTPVRPRRPPPPGGPPAASGAPGAR